jgi:hypothetical protein
VRTDLTKIQRERGAFHLYRAQLTTHGAARMKGVEHFSF